MSLPKFPTDPSALTREGAINQVIASIAMEELGLSHILNAEGEKLQYVLGTLDGISGPGATIEEVIQVNESVTYLLEKAASNQRALSDKLKAAVSSPVLTGPTGPQGPQGPQGTSNLEVIPITVDGYLALSDTEKRDPGIIWVIYPDDFILA
ncbi:MAG: hypothetical protein FWD03_03890 [Defluviitaleaceae bacterium]|nr:hypothetical protein [Defluviitaleaceae bacterium]